MFGRVKSRPDQDPGDESDDQTSPRFEYYEPALQQMMRRMGYDITSKQGLNFS